MQVGYLFDHPGTVLFSVFMSFWAVTFLEYWKRKMATLAHHWDCMDFHEEEVSHSFLSHLLSVRKCLSRSAMYLILDKNRNSRSKPKGTGTNLKMGQTWKWVVVFLSWQDDRLFVSRVIVALLVSPSGNALSLPLHLATFFFIGTLYNKF